MAQDTKYNGWTNYATWRINLELADDTVQNMSENHAPGYADVYELSKAIQEYCEEYVTDSAPEGLAVDYAMAFMSDVNWYEIAEHAAQDYPQLVASADEDEDEDEATA